MYMHKLPYMYMYMYCFTKQPIIMQARFLFVKSCTRPHACVTDCMRDDGVREDLSVGVHIYVSNIRLGCLVKQEKRQQPIYS